jgi:hypothetical protein
MESAGRKTSLLGEFSLIAFSLFIYEPFKALNKINGHEFFFLTAFIIVNYMSLVSQLFEQKRK